MDVHWIEWPKRFGGTWEEFISEIKRENRFEADALHIGISFGGLVAQRMASDMKAKGVVLVGSFSNRSSIAWVFRVLLSGVRFVPARCFDIGLLPHFLVRHYFGIRTREEVDLFFTMAGRLDGSKAKALVGFIGSAIPKRPGGLPMLRIHGARDRILPMKNQVVDTVIEGGGHLISVTDSGQINARITDWIAKGLKK
jgi:pimeloyl-ACP methyl ester carboxylesterase